MSQPGFDLLIDIGNSRLKWARAEGDALHAGTPLDHSEPLVPQLEVAWRGLSTPQRVLVSSVARPQLDDELRHVLASRFAVAPEFVRSAPTLGGVRSSYAQPHKLGVDRLLALVALHAAQPTATVLASVGTALTLDALAADGRHLGGLIAPSPGLAQQALLGATARVTASVHAQLTEMATDTEDAVRSGCWLGAVALIERFHAQATVALGAAPKLVLAGGDGPLLQQWISVPARYEPDLVLRGLMAWASAK